jgi:hypothetical protein
MGMAFLGLLPEQFFEMRLCYFFNALNMFLKNERERERYTAELVRMQTTELLNIQLKKADRILPAQLWAFPWDEDNEPELLTDEEIKRQHEAILEKFK